MQNESSRSRFGSTRDGVCIRMLLYAVYCCRMSARHSYSLHGPIAMLHLFWYVFADKFFFNSILNLTIRKGIRRRIQRCNLRREILSTFHTRVYNQWIRHFCIVFTPKLPLRLRRSPPKSNTPIPSLTPLTTPNGIPIQSPVSPLLTCENQQMGQAKVLSHKRFALWSEALKIKGSDSPQRRQARTVPCAYASLQRKRHLDRFSRFCRADGRDQHTDTEMLATSLRICAAIVRCGL